MPASISIEALSEEAFAPFGQVISCDNKQPVMINEGTTERYHALAQVELLGEGSQAIINVFRAQPRPWPLELKGLERHPLGSQSFFPLNAKPWLVVVASQSEQPQLGDVRVFLARGDQGVNYKAGTWHHPLLALGEQADFMVVDRSGPGNNCDEQGFPEPLYLEEASLVAALEALL